MRPTEAAILTPNMMGRKADRRVQGWDGGSNQVSSDSPYKVNWGTTMTTKQGPGSEEFMQFLKVPLHQKKVPGLALVRLAAVWYDSLSRGNPIGVDILITSVWVLLLGDLFAVLVVGFMDLEPPHISG